VPTRKVLVGTFLIPVTFKLTIDRKTSIFKWNQIIMAIMFEMAFSNKNIKGEMKL
jgi:hypothetical protein